MTVVKTMTEHYIGYFLYAEMKTLSLIKTNAITDALVFHFLSNNF